MNKYNNNIHPDEFLFYWTELGIAVLMGWNVCIGLLLAKKFDYLIASKST